MRVEVQPSGSPQPSGAAGESPVTVRPSKQRWYMLLVCFLYSMTQSCVWNTFGPISTTSKEVFDWTDANISLLSACGPIAFVLTGPVFSWIIEEKGLRVAYLISSTSTAIGTAFRCITFKKPTVTWLITIGHLLNGLGGPIALCGPSAVSALWFPSGERTTALAIGIVGAYTGLGLAFIMGPNVIPELSNKSSEADNGEESSEVKKARDAIANYMYFEAGWSALIFILIVFHFPSKPRHPPSASAGITRENYWDGVRKLSRNSQALLVVAVCSMTMGVVNGFASLLNVTLEKVDVSQTTAGWIGFYAIVSACFMSLTVARYADMFTHFVKEVAFSLIAVALLAFLILKLAFMGVIPKSLPLFYATIIIGISCINALNPILINLACELAYPVGEGTTAFLVNLSTNVLILIVLLIMMIPNIGSTWITWALVAILAVSVPILMLVKVTFNRLAVDLLHTVTSTVSENSKE